jgi:hypothetical protein
MVLCQTLYTFVVDSIRNEQLFKDKSSVGSSKIQAGG